MTRRDAAWPATRKARGATIIRYRDVVKRYGAFTALSGVSLRRARVRGRVA
jgi:hypothetical protein